MKKVFALILCLIMLMGVFPATAAMAEETVAASAGESSNGYYDAPKFTKNLSLYMYVRSGEKVKLSVYATNAVNYWWHYSDNGGKSWTSGPIGTNSYVFTATSAMNGRLIKCVAKSYSGTAYSNVLKLYVKSSSSGGSHVF